MIFTEARFFAFLALVLVFHWGLRGHRSRKALLLFSSQLFYAAWDPRFLTLIWISVLTDYGVGLWMERLPVGQRRAPLIVSLSVNLGLLGAFKYWNFFVGSAVELTAWLGLPLDAPLLQVVLPLGISFYTFQTLSYSIDVGRGRLRATHSLLDFALFVSFFPQLVAGPIVRAAHFLPQLAEPKRFTDVAWRSQLLLFLSGFVKKACVADQAARAVDAVFAAPEAYGNASKWLASLLYSLQIYGDFSGYSDMAIATAGMLGYRLARNFDAPYLASSMRDFWRRWHISLSTWFRDYLYLPLGGNRGSSAATARNLWVVFLISGLWHGAAWTFVVWGLWHGLFLSLERLADPGRLGRAFGHAYTLLIVNLGFVIFRSPDLEAALRFIAGLFSPGPSGARSLSPWWWALLAVFALAQIAVAGRLFETRLRSMPDPAFALAYGAAVALALPFVATGYKPFIYFQF